MHHRIVVEHGGKPYTVERQPGAPGTGSGSAVPERWVVTLAASAITTLDAVPGEPDDAVRARLTAWLDRRPDLDARDTMHLGGG